MRGVQVLHHQEGQTREGRLATDTTAEPAAAATPTTAPRPTVDAAGSRAPETPAAGGVGVQVGAYSSRAAAESGWNLLNRQTDALKGVRYRIMEGPEVFHRFVVIEFPTLEAGAACFESPEYVEAASFRRGGAGIVENVIVEGGDATT